MASKFVVCKISNKHSKILQQKKNEIGIQVYGKKNPWFIDMNNIFLIIIIFLKMKRKKKIPKYETTMKVNGFMATLCSLAIA